MTDTWNPTQYDKFQTEREQPFHDLLALVRPAPGMRVVDLGCGTGRLTLILHEHLHARETIGLDRSPRMLEAQTPDANPAVRFEVGTIESFPGSSSGFHLIFSNAALHWVEDHAALLERLAGALLPAGQLAFQVPASHDQPSHLVAEELTGVEPFRSAFNGWHRPQPVRSPEEYARLLYRLGFHDPVVQLIVYPHVLNGPDAVVEWMKGTLLTEYARHLPPEMYDRFLAEYRSRLLARIEQTQPFFFPFKRILCWGQRSA